MVRAHSITAEARVEIASGMIAHEGEYGYVTRLGRAQSVSRQSLYLWRDRGEAALLRAFTPTERVAPVSVSPRAILTLLIEGHASERGIQRCLEEVAHQSVSVGKISAVIVEAKRRAVDLLAAEQPGTTRPLAFDEIFGQDAHHAYLSVVDAVSGAVWLAEGPVTVDAESWTLALWEGHDRGLRWTIMASDGGSAFHQACRMVDPTGRRQRDVWHVLHQCSRVHGRLARQVTALEQQTATVERQAARIAAGKPPLGRYPKTDLPGHRTAVAAGTRTVDALSYLSDELHRLSEVVVLGREGVLDAATRQAELETVLALLAELRDTAPDEMQEALRRLHTGLSRALPDLLTFVRLLEPVQQAVLAQLGSEAMALVGWAWQRRAILGPTTADVLAQLPADWRASVAILLAAWEDCVRASSLAETWHSIVRPHLAVHRRLSPGLLALIAVWYNHHVAPRGIHIGTSPLQRSGFPQAEVDWLTALDYPSDAATNHDTEPLARAA